MRLSGGILCKEFQKDIQQLNFTTKIQQYQYIKYNSQDHSHIITSDKKLKTPCFLKHK